MAGDYPGDGLADVVIGAWSVDAYAGEAWLFASDDLAPRLDATSSN